MQGMSNELETWWECEAAGPAGLAPNAMFDTWADSA